MAFKSAILCLLVAAIAVAERSHGDERSERVLTTPKPDISPATVSKAVQADATSDVRASVEEKVAEGRLIHNDVNKGRRRSAARKTAKKGRKSNEDLMHRLGLTEVQSPSVNHHRKRLASQSRKSHNQKAVSDSKMFIVKLPPNPYFYGHSEPAKRFETKTINALPSDFNFNGKPSKVYHWNVPVMKQMIARKTGSTGDMSIVAGDSDLFNVRAQSTWDDTGDDLTAYRKTSYYKPRRPTKRILHRYFTANGKPHSFYIIEKSRKPVYHRLLP